LRREVQWVDTNRPFQFQKGRQLFIGSHNETFSVVAMASAIQIVRRLESMADTQPQPALLRLSVMISQKQYRTLMPGRPIGGRPIFDHSAASFTASRQNPLDY